MEKSFSTKEFGISFDLLKNGNLLGIFEASKYAISHEFRGFYDSTGPAIMVSFLIDWKLKTLAFNSFTAFSGSIKVKNGLESLELDWLLLLEGESQVVEYCNSKSPLVLTSGYKCDLEVDKPFPDALIKDMVISNQKGLNK